MIATRQSEARKPNPKLVLQPRKKGQNNVQWVADALKGDPGGWVLLFGGTGLTDFRVRVAQSHARQDMLPSFWSHCAIIRRQAGKSDYALYEVSLNPASGFGFVPKNNGVQEGKLSRYADPEAYPNIACIHFPIKPEALPKTATTFSKALEEAVTAFRRQRNLMDMGALIVEWLAFVWGSGDRGNPLLKGLGVPSAVLLESAFALAGLELTPGLASQSSCPEAIWQSARWWHDFFLSEAAITAKAPEGKYVIDQGAAAVVE